MGVFPGGGRGGIGYQISLAVALTTAWIIALQLSCSVCEYPCSHTSLICSNYTLITALYIDGVINLAEKSLFETLF